MEKRPAEESIPELVAEPHQVTRAVAFWRARCLDLESENAPGAVLHENIRFMGVRAIAISESLAAVVVLPAGRGPTIRTAAWWLMRCF